MIKFMTVHDLIFYYYALTAAQAYSLATFGVGTGPIVLDNVNCRGNETTLVSCPHDPDTSDCFHFEDAGVSCAESPSELNKHITFYTVYTYCIHDQP